MKMKNYQLHGNYEILEIEIDSLVEIYTYRINFYHKNLF